MPESRELIEASGTSKPEMVSAFVDGKEYLLIDTPGFNDTWKDLKRSDAKILGEIAQTLTLQHQLGVELVRPSLIPVMNLPVRV